MTQINISCYGNSGVGYNVTDAVVFRGQYDKMQALPVYLAYAVLLVTHYINYLSCLLESKT